jgi:Mrp family chromosome partitioning ATPase
MTALDQAFIKAFTQQGTSPLPGLARSTAVAPSPDADRDDAARAKRGTPKAKADKPKVAPRKPRRPNGRSAAAPAALAAAPVESLGVAASRRTSVALAPEPAAPAAMLDQVWAALEQPAATAADVKADGGPKREPREAGSAQRPARAPSLELPAASLAPRSPATESQPLRLETPARPQEFKPAWQVDAFTWPRVCRRLIARAAEELDRLADALLAANHQGQKVLAMGGCSRGEGATTLLLCAARRLAERGIKPVLVDADLARPRLAKRLGVQPQFGWDETTDAEGHWLDQAIVEATANNLALLPVREPPAECGRPAGDPSRLAACLGVLRSHYDLVLVDPGPLMESKLLDGFGSGTPAGMIDAVVLVRNEGITSESQLTAYAGQLATAGVAVAGVVDNFVAEP